MIDYNNHKTTNQERKQAMNNVAQKNEKSIVGAIKINEKEIGDHLNQLVRQTVEDTLNSLLDAEADAICNADTTKLKCHLQGIIAAVLHGISNSATEGLNCKIEV